MKQFYAKITEKIQAELLNIDIERCDISINESVRMIKFLDNCLSELRDFFLTLKTMSVQDEAAFFKEMKPEVLQSNHVKGEILFSPYKTDNYEKIYITDTYPVYHLFYFRTNTFKKRDSRLR